MRKITVQSWEESENKNKKGNDKLKNKKKKGKVQQKKKERRKYAQFLSSKWLTPLPTSLAWGHFVRFSKSSYTGD